MVADPTAAADFTAADHGARITAVEGAVDSLGADLAKLANDGARALGAGPDFIARMEAIEARLEKWAPTVEGLAEAGIAAEAQGHSILSILRGVAGQMFGVKL